MHQKNKKILLWILDLTINVGIIFILVIVIQKWIIAPFDVFGASMCDTLNNIKEECINDYGEKIIINEAGYIFGEPERGNIIVFTMPDEKTEDGEEKYFIKRIIGLPGDTVEIKDGEVFIIENSTKKSIKIDENYLNEINKGNTGSKKTTFKVPKEKYFVMGDNRGASTDSRSCFHGDPDVGCKQKPENTFVDRENIRGKAWFVWWPLKNIRTLEQGSYPELEPTT